MRTLTLEDAHRYAQEAVQERGEDYVYPRRDRTMRGILNACLYVYNGKPDCLVGVILHKAGVPLEELRYCQEDLDDSSASSVLPTLRERGVLQVEPYATEFLIALQMSQDSGDTWGYALSRANARTSASIAGFQP